MRTEEIQQSKKEVKKENIKKQYEKAIMQYQVFTKKGKQLIKTRKYN